MSGTAQLSGRISLGPGSRELVFDGVDIGGLDGFDGGGGTTLAFRGVNGELDASFLSDWKTVEIGAGSRVEFVGAGLASSAAETLAVIGTMAFGASGAAGDGFTVEGDFSGGGQVEIDADFEAGSADELVIEGDVTGTTALLLNDVRPDESMPAGGSIDVVTVMGEVATTAFRLEGETIHHGAFTYGLEYLTDDGKFVLRPGDMVNDVGAVLKSASPAIASGFGKAATLSDRTLARRTSAAGFGAPATIGERALSFVGQGGAHMAEAENDVWMRLHSDKHEYGDGDIEIHSKGIQLGIDIFAKEGASGKWVVGLSARHGTMNARARGQGGVGIHEASGHGLGAMLTWFGDGGIYADGQAQFSLIDSDYRTESAGTVLIGNRAQMAAASLEAGWKIALGDAAVVVPQGQIGWNVVGAEHFISNHGVEVNFASERVLEARLGVMAEIALPWGGIHIMGDVLRSLQDSKGVAVAGRPVAHEAPDGWAEIGVGGSLDMSEHSVLFLDGTWRTGLGDGADYAVGTSLSGGLKFTW